MILPVFRLRLFVPWALACVLLTACSRPAGPTGIDAMAPPVLPGDQLIVGTTDQESARLVAVDLDSGSERVIVESAFPRNIGTSDRIPEVMDADQRLLCASVSPDFQNLLYGVRTEGRVGGEQGLYVDGCRTPCPASAFVGNVRWNSDSSRFAFVQSIRMQSPYDSSALSGPSALVFWAIYSTTTRSVRPLDAAEMAADTFWWTGDDTFLLARDFLRHNGSIVAYRGDASGPIGHWSYGTGAVVAVAASRTGGRVLVAIERFDNNDTECDLWLTDASCASTKKIGTYKPCYGAYFAQWEDENVVVANVMTRRDFDKGNQNYATRINVATGATSSLVEPGDSPSWLNARLWDGTYVVTTAVRDTTRPSGGAIFRVERRAANGSFVRELYRSATPVLVFGAIRGGA